MLLSLSSFVDLFKYAAQLDDAMVGYVAFVVCTGICMKARRAAWTSQRYVIELVQATKVIEA